MEPAPRSTIDPGQVGRWGWHASAISTSLKTIRRWRRSAISTSLTTIRRWRVAALSIIAALAVTSLAGIGAIEVWLKSVDPLPLSGTTDISTTVLDRDGRLLRAFTTTSGRWRLPVEIDDVDPRYIEMLLAFEDRRFWDHPGVDPIGLARASVQLATSGRIVSGASTLSMQVARLVSGEHLRTLSGKLRQMAWALHLERQLSKRAILSLYLKLAPFGGNVEGVRAASLSYFGKEPKRLSAAEAALLVALPQSPERRRPDRHAASARAARDHVLDVAAERGIISRADADRAKLTAVPRLRRAFPKLAPHVAEREVAAAPHARMHRLTIDRDVQMRLEALAREGAARLGPKLSVAILAADHTTGEIVAEVGSASYFDAGRFGAVDMANAIRSPGSTLKPLIYGLAFDAGIAHPQTLIEDKPTRFGAYAPKNFGEDFKGTITVGEALAQSLNIPAVKMLDRVGPGLMVGRMRSAGIATELPKDAEPNLSVALGGIGMDLRNLVTLYAGLANGGRPTNLRHRADLDGAAAGTGTGGHAAERLISEVSAHYLTTILRTAPPPPDARGGEIAFKTGTSYGFRDAWAIGYDGRHVIGIWVGRADATAVPGLVGRTAAAPILFDAFKRVAAKRTPFREKPYGTIDVAGGELPPPLRRFERQVLAADQRFLSRPVRIVFPPDRSEVAVDAADPMLILRAEGGTLPLTWLVDDKPVDGPQHGHDFPFEPAGTGFVHLKVIDAQGRVDRATVRLQQ